MRLLLITLFCVPYFLFAQKNDNLDELPQEVVQLVEDFVAESDAEFDFNALLDDLMIYYRRPLQLKHATRDDLIGLNLLSEYQVDQYYNHVEKFGNLISVYELQTIPGFTATTVQMIRPFISVSKNGLDDFQLPLFKMLYQGDNELLLRTTTFSPKESAYTDFGDNPPFEGDPFRVYSRYKHSYYNRLSYGITMEKDRGEALFKKSNPQGFDFYSAHFFLKNYRKWLKSLAIGDFSASLGQGLIMYSGFGGRKGAQVDKIARSQNGLRAYRSVDENNFLRGAGVELSLFDKIEVMAFGSQRLRDANILQVNDTTLTDEDLAITSLQTSGLHRTESEIEDEKSITQTTIGGRVAFATNRFRISANAVHEKLSRPLERNTRPYNLFYFGGTDLTNVSLDYRWSRKNYTLFGELARSANGGVAFSNGLQVTLSRIADLSMLYRSFDRNYEALNANPFSEASGALNEKGLYSGLSIRPNYNWQFSAYYDFYRFDWLRFGINAPSTGRDFRGRLTWRKKRKFETYLEPRAESRNISIRLVGENESFLAKITRRQLRWNLSYNISKAFTWRSRVDIGDLIIGPVVSKGVVVYQDFIYKPKISLFPFHLSARIALFDTDNYAIRFYSYENNLLNSFSIPPYYGKGLRYYFNARYKGIRNLILEARWAQTYRTGNDPYLGGRDGFPGNHDTEFSFQLKYSWGK